MATHRLSRTTTPSDPTPHPRPPACSTSCSSTAIAPSRTTRTRGHCPRPHGSKARWPTSSTPWSPPFPRRAWSPTSPICSGRTVNLFHRAVDRVQRELDTNEERQRRSQQEQDGSEIRSVELERLIAEGLTLIERRNAFELLRDHAAELFEHHTGSAWRPRAGSMVNHRALTAAMIDSRDFIAAKRRAETEVLLPAGPRIAFAGGVDFNDHERIWAVLDRVHRKHADMVLLHGGSPRGAERIAACWADARKVTQIAFKPEWARHNKAAPFKRNDRMLETMPIGVDRLPRFRHLREPRRQGADARHPRVALRGRRRMSAAFTRLQRALGPASIPRPSAHKADNVGGPLIGGSVLRRAGCKWSETARSCLRYRRLRCARSGHSSLRFQTLRRDRHRAPRESHRQRAQEAAPSWMLA